MRKYLSLILAIAVFCSCDTISSIVHDDEVVAKVGKHKLYKSELAAYIPEFASPDDSVNLAMQYINSWATEYLYMEVASEQLSKTEMDVTAELEDYRRSLLKYRYEQRYVNDRLDTLITQQQIQKYYNDNKQNFELERPIMKVRFIDIMKGAPNKDIILKKMSSPDYEDVGFADSLARSAALRYWDNSEQWIDAVVLAKEFGMDYESMLKHLNGDFIKVESDDRPDLMAAYICEMQIDGVAPVEYCEEKIRDFILSARKHQLLADLEQDLLTNALSHKNLVIY